MRSAPIWRRRRGRAVRLVSRRDLPGGHGDACSQARSTRPGSAATRTSPIELPSTSSPSLSGGACPSTQAYVIVPAERRGASGLMDLAGDVHAFSDPDSNSGYLVTAAALAAKRLRPQDFFAKAFFTYSPSQRHPCRGVRPGRFRKRRWLRLGGDDRDRPGP